MPLTFVLLQLVNAVLAGATLWIHFRNPFLWDDQAIIYATCGGTLVGCLTAIILGISLMLREDVKFGAAFLNLILTLAFAGMQGWFLYLTGRDIGVMEILKAKLGQGG